MKSDGLKKNLFFQFSYQFIVLVVPLIMAPYLTRTLGKEAIGIYSYTYSIAYYFVLVCMLGIVKHGQRIIASVKDDPIQLRKTFWSLFTLHFIVSSAVFIFYCIACVSFLNENQYVYFAQSLYVLSALFDITWFFYGIEKFKTVVIRNTMVKITELLLTVLFVKAPEDLIIYTIIMSGALLVSQISLLPAAIRIVKPITFSTYDISKHIKPMLVLSVSVLAISLYTVFDKTLLGMMTNTNNVALYEYANKIITIPKLFVIVIGTVLFPRACNSIAVGDIGGAKRYYNYSLMVVYFISFGSIFGLLGIADLFSIKYYGDAFAECGKIIKAMAPLVLIIGLGDTFRMQYLIPLKKDAQYTVCAILNAIINIVISFALIPKYGVYGAVIGTTAAELFGVLYQGFLVRGYVNIKKTITQMIPFAVSGVLMFGGMEIIKTFANDSIGHLLLQILSGALIYVICTVVWLLIISENKDTYRGIIKASLKKERMTKG